MSGFYPIGVIVNAVAVALGGAVGTLLGPRIPAAYKENLNSIFGLAGITMGVTTVVMVKNLPAVIFSVIMGTVIGMMLMLEKRLEKLSLTIQNRISAGAAGPASDQAGQIAGIVTIAVLFCASGTGIYGSMVSGISGDQSMLLSKSILDFFTAIIFASTLGWIVSLIAVPQVVIFLALFFFATAIMPLTTPDMISDFRACGGVIMMAAGFRILKLKMFPITDMIPAMFLVFPVSWFWGTFVLPLVS